MAGLDSDEEHGLEIVFIKMLICLRQKHMLFQYLVVISINTSKSRLVF